MYYVTAAWLVVGALTGFLAGGAARQSVPEMTLSVILGVAGATAAHWTFIYLMPSATSALELYAVVAAALGGAVVSKTYRLVFAD